MNKKNGTIHLTAKPDERQLSISRSAFRFCSNEEDFGIFCQGVMVGLVCAFGPAMKEAGTDPNPADINSTIRLYDMFITSKRRIEIMWATCPEPWLGAERVKALSQLEEMWKMWKEERSS